MRTDFNKLKYGLELGGSLSRKSGAVKSSVIQKKWASGQCVIFHAQMQKVNIKNANQF